MKLVVETQGGKPHLVPIDRARFVVGRDPACDLTLDDGEMSRQHAAFAARPDGSAELRDLGSTNGTFVDGRRIGGPVVLTGGEVVRIGRTKFTLEAGEPGALDAPAPHVAADGVERASRGSAEEAAAPTAPTPSAIQRLVLRKSTRRATALAGVAILVAVTVAVLFATGVIRTSGGGGPTVAEVVKKVAPSVVLVEALVDGKPESSGSGWVLDASKGLIVTNAHVVNGGSTFRVSVGGRLISADVAGVAPCEDLAVLKASGAGGLKTLPLGSQSEVEQGETVVAIGYPTNASLSDNLTSTSGVVSVVKTKFRFPSLDLPVFANVLQTDTAINPGNSGGPLVDLDSKLVGVNTAGLVAVDGQPIESQGYAIGVDQVRRVTSQLRAGKSIGWTGAGFEFPTEPELAEKGLPPGLIITHVVDESPAQKAGLGEKPVLVTAVDGKPIDNTLRSYCAAVRGVPRGKSVPFSILAGEGGSIEVDVEIL